MGKPVIAKRVNCFNLKRSVLMSECVFIGRIERGEVKPISDSSDSLFNAAVEIARSVTLGRAIENRLLVDVFDTDEK